MKLVSYSLNGDLRRGAGIVHDGRLLELPHHDVVDALRAQVEGRLSLRDARDERSLEDVRLGAPVPRPSKIICVGLNYRDHAGETDMPVPEVPVVFAKFPNSITGPDSPIELPALTSQVDWEAELAVVIGRAARNVTPEQALDAIGGYMNMNDVSARDVQLGEGGQWTRGKSFDTFAPTGPYLVTADEIRDPQDLAIECAVNGQTMQSSSTSHMIFPIAEIVSFISRALTLNPGDIVATGTPPGVGMARQPPVYLQDGDEVVVEISGLGRLRNHVRAGT